MDALCAFSTYSVPSTSPNSLACESVLEVSYASASAASTVDVAAAAGAVIGAWVLTAPGQPIAPRAEVLGRSI